MDPRQALQILDQVARSFQGSREDHQNLSMALAVLQSIISDKEAAEKEATMKSAEEKASNPTPEEETTEQKAEETAS